MPKQHTIGKQTLDEYHSDILLASSSREVKRLTVDITIHNGSIISKYRVTQRNTSSKGVNHYGFDQSTQLLELAIEWYNNLTDKTQFNH